MSTVGRRALCAFCKRPEASQTCSGCHVVVYCGKECQKADWISTHKVLCKTLATAAAARASAAPSAKAAGPEVALVHSVRAAEGAAARAPAASIAKAADAVSAVRSAGSAAAASRAVKALAGFLSGPVESSEWAHGPTGVAYGARKASLIDAGATAALLACCSAHKKVTAAVLTVLSRLVAGPRDKHWATVTAQLAESGFTQILLGAINSRSFISSSCGDVAVYVASAVIFKDGTSGSLRRELLNAGAVKSICEQFAWLSQLADVEPGSMEELEMMDGSGDTLNAIGTLLRSLAADRLEIVTELESARVSETGKHVLSEIFSSSYFEPCVTWSTTQRAWFPVPFNLFPVYTEEDF